MLPSCTEINVMLYVFTGNVPWCSKSAQKFQITALTGLEAKYAKCTNQWTGCELVTNIKALGSLSLMSLQPLFTKWRAQEFLLGPRPKGWGPRAGIGDGVLREGRQVPLHQLTGRLHGTIVGPTGRTDWSVRLVGQTSRTDQSDRPVCPTIVPCKRPVRVCELHSGVWGGRPRVPLPSVRPWFTSISNKPVSVFSYPLYIWCCHVNVIFDVCTRNVLWVTWRYLLQVYWLVLWSRRSRGVRHLCLCQIWSGYLYSFKSYKVVPKFRNLVTWPLAHLGVVLWSGRSRGPSSMSVPNLKHLSIRSKVIREVPRFGKFGHVT